MPAPAGSGHSQRRKGTERRGALPCVVSAEGRAIPDALTGTASFEIKDTANVFATGRCASKRMLPELLGRQSILIYWTKFEGEQKCYS